MDIHINTFPLALYIRIHFLLRFNLIVLCVMSSVLSSKYFKVHIFSLIVIIRTNSDLLICILEFTLGYLWINWVGLRSSGILHSVMTMQYSRGSKRCHDMVQYSRSAKNIMTLQYSRGSKKCHDTAIFQRFKEVSWHCNIPEVQRSVVTWCDIPEVQRISWHCNIPEVLYFINSFLALLIYYLYFYITIVT